MIDHLLLTAQKPDLPHAGQSATWGGLTGASAALAVAELARSRNEPLLVVASDPRSAEQFEAELRFFAGDKVTVGHFVDWESLPWDSFSPHQDITSARLRTLADLPGMCSGIVVAAAPVLLQRLPPVSYVAARSLSLAAGQQIAREMFTESLISNGYLRVPQVSEHGEFAVRGSLIDVFPSGSDQPIRIDFFDDEIESLRFFSAESQRSGEAVDQIDLLPARETPLDAEAIRQFRSRYRERFEGQPSRSRVYRDISAGIAHGGIEYFLPLFFEETASLLDYLPRDCRIILPPDLTGLLESSWSEIGERYEIVRLDAERPVLKPEETFWSPRHIDEQLARMPIVTVSSSTVASDSLSANFPSRLLPPLKIESRYEEPAARLVNFVESFDGRLLFTAESPGRREQLIELLNGRGIHVARANSWHHFLDLPDRIAVALAPVEAGVVLGEPSLAIIADQQLFGLHSRRRSRSRRFDRDPETIIRQLNDLESGSPVVHADYGIGRYIGLITLEVGDVVGEYLHLEYADGDKLYVPVHSLELISRYTGASGENAPLHRLGSDQWAKAKQRAITKIRDVAAELLDIYARRAARPGHRFHWLEPEYRAFESGFPFDLTEDQEQTIDDVLTDLRSDNPMDRVVCGDVGFGKTEVALRAAFVAVLDGKQVAVLVPTTLLAQQHGQTFRDRFADWPVRVEVLSRFQTAKQVRQITEGMRDGAVDIVIGTHRLLQHTRDFKDVGLVVVDEEHRFGVRHKESITALRSQVDVLTLTATPIPRTLNMALGGLRDMSLIATPPAQRLSVKTFVSEWNDALIREALLREIKRGGQAYFIHNRIEDIEKIADRVRALVPEASLCVGHGQMPERELERVMLDFYHRRFNILLCTTIVESGIDVPTANTIVINRADRFGLAQLHQLRGRVGRSHHRAYAYLLAPPRAALSADAVKRLDAIDSLEDLGSGFVLATHDLEIRGAGELLGDIQSGQIQEIGFSLYMELLGRAVDSLRAGREPDLEGPLDSGLEINFHAAALLPDDYVPDVHLRLILYKRIASTHNEAQLSDLQVELIDRFGLLPEAVKNLFRITAIKQHALRLGIEKIDVSDRGGYLVFGAKSHIDPIALVKLVQSDSGSYKLQGSHRLRFTMNLTELGTRFKKTEELLAALTLESDQSAAIA